MLTTSCSFTTSAYCRHKTNLPIQPSQLWLVYQIAENTTIVGMSSDVCDRFGKRVRSLRKNRGWRQLDLAEHAGISENYVSDLELGRKEICLRTIETLSQAFEMTITDLLSSV